jgi:MarR family 2-MHQ and catechol resistance regulon transcriptional repressor
MTARTVKLQQELRLKQPLASDNHEALLNLVRTSSMLLKLSDRFFSQFGLTDAQFNILMILNDYGGEGMSQQDLSEHLIVTKSNMVGLVDRLEKTGHVRRKSHPTDRRSYQVMLTAKGREVVEKIKKSYFREVDRMMSVLTDSQKRSLILSMEKLRQYLNERQA